MNMQHIKRRGNLIMGFAILAMLVSCGNDESSEDGQELAGELQQGKDVFSIFGLFNGNLKCNANKTIEDCADGINSGGLRFTSDSNSVLGAVWINLFGEDVGRSGCTFRGKDSDIQCRVSCDRMSNNILGLCSSQADGCEWNEETSKCEKPVSTTISNLASGVVNTFKSLIGRKDINDMETLIIENQNCPKTCRGFTLGCTGRGNQCSSSCDRIKKKVLCRFSAGCSWSGLQCK